MPATFQFVSVRPTHGSRGGRASAAVRRAPAVEGSRPETPLRPQTPAAAEEHEEEAVECCVCLERTDALTPCQHPLCGTCRKLLPKALCPLCRRELRRASDVAAILEAVGSRPALLAADGAQSLAGAHPAPEGGVMVRASTLDAIVSRASVLAAVGVQTLAGAHPAPEDGAVVRAAPSLRQAVGTSRSQPLSPLSPGRRAGSPHGGTRERQRRRAPPRLLLRCELGRFGTLGEALSAAEELRAFMPGQGAPGRGEALPHQGPREQLSSAVAELLGRATLQEIAAASARLHGLLSCETLIPVLVLPAVREKVRHAAEQIPSIREFAWEDVKALILCLNRLRECETLAPFVDGVARKVALQVGEAMKLTVMARPALEILASGLVLDAWPAAHRAYEEAGEAVRSLVRQRLLAAARRFSSGAEASPPSPPSAVPVGSLQLLVETMSAVGICGHLDHQSTSEICSALVPGLVREGVKTAGTLGWSHADSGPVVARQLAVQMSQRPEYVRYHPEGRVLVFNCRSSMFGPSTPTSGASSGGSTPSERRPSSNVRAAFPGLASPGGRQARLP